MFFFDSASFEPKIWCFLLLNSMMLFRPHFINGQQIQWAKLYALPKQDQINCIVKDDSYLYAGGYTYRNAVLNNYYKAMLIKMDLNGDTVFARDLGFTGHISCIAVDPWGNLKLTGLATGIATWDYPVSISMTPNGFIFRRDTLRGIPLACTMGKDSSLIVVGYRGRTGFPGQTSMYFQRIHTDGTIDPFVELNPNHPDCMAYRVEQLPNGHYLVSGYVGSRIASYELDEWGMNPVFKEWYQTPDFSNMNSGYVSRINEQRYMLGGQGGPCIVGQYDSFLNKYWLKKDIGTQVPPQAMVDGSVVFAYNKNTAPYNEFFRFGADSSTIWYVNLRDSLSARSITGSIDLYAFTFFEDQSAVVAGTIYKGAVLQNDPFFLKIANVGTPVTSLSKPKPGPLKNETLAPWPNPTGGTLYLKQHFNQAEVHFYEISGKEVGQFQIRFGQPIDVSGFPAGVYLYRANIDGKAFSGKVIKN